MKLKNGQDAETIARELMEKKEDIEEIIKVAKEHALEYDTEKILLDLSSVNVKYYGHE